MPLPFKIDSLDKVPESARELYEQDGDSFQLSVEGLPAPEDTSGLKSALAKQKRRIAELEAKVGKVTDEDIEELETLRAAARKQEEDEAKKAGKWDELRAKLQKDHDRELEAERAKTRAESDKNQRRDRRLIRDSLAAQIAKVGAKPEYFDAVEAMIERRHKLAVEWGDDDDVQVMVVDEVHGNKPLGDWMGEWAKSEAASPFMPPENGAGGGGSGQDRGGGKRPSYEGKKFSEMTVDEQVAYTDAKYGEGAAA